MFNSNPVNTKLYIRSIEANIGRSRFSPMQRPWLEAATR
jgi:hypothetical protein